jgi:hypothetical protein
MKISIRDMLHSYAGSLKKDWAHDRTNTVGASEIGQCLRKTWFAKNDQPQDPGYVDRFGARLRGDLIEQYYWVPALRASLPEGVELLFAGDQQKTLVDGYLSATPDGLLVGPDKQCVAVECKSIDPRVDIRVEKPEHSFQTQVQVGLIRFATHYQPEHAIISYVDASFLDDVREFTVPFDPNIYAAAQQRARKIMTSDDPLSLPPEGKIAGGDECRYCAWASHCAAVTVAGIPKEEKTLGANAAAALKDLRDDERYWAEEQDRSTEMHGVAKEKIKEFLRENQIRRYIGEDWSVSWSSVKGRASLDTAAMEAAGIDLRRYQKIGDPSDRLTVK